MDEYRDTKGLVPERKKRRVTIVQVLFIFVGALLTIAVVACGVWLGRSNRTKNVFFSERENDENDSNEIDPALTENLKVGTVPRPSGIDYIFEKKDDLTAEDHTRAKNQFIFDRGLKKQCHVKSDDFRFDCHPEDGASVSKCEARGCCWAPPKTVSVKSPGSLGVPYCYYPTDYPQYYVVNYTNTGQDMTAFLARNTSSYYSNDVKLLRMDVTFTKNIVRTKIYDPIDPRYEVPYSLRDAEIRSSVEQSNLDVEVKNYPFSFRITHKTTKKILFDIGLGAFIYTDQFIQFSTTISKYIYGLGERRDNFLRSVDWQRFTLFPVDPQAPISNSNLYGSHPFTLQVDVDGTSFGTLLYNSNAMEVILQPAPAATYRILGGIIDLVVFSGPTPADVIRQYVRSIGLPLMPPFWSLGFHLSRYGLKTANQTRELWERTVDAKIPFDVQWNDIDYMDQRRDFTYDKINYADLPQLVDDIHQAGMRYVVILDPALDAPKNPKTYPPYAEGLQRGIFINGSDGKPFIGKVWSPDGAAWPDFTNPATTDFWTKQISSFRKEIPFDGLWIDMNEPSNEYDGTKTGCPDSPYENPPYLPLVYGGKLYAQTVCMTAQQHAGLHYDVHSLYGYSETIATNKALKKVRKGKRPFIIGRSTFPGQGHFGGHWTGDVYSTWDDMRKSIPGILDFNLFGIPLVGADICGFHGNTTVELCTRWVQLGAFYPFSRNHNDRATIDQDPVALGPEVVTASIYALELRYTMLPYLYTLFYRAHVHGDTVARPLFFEFAPDEKTYAIDTQFLLGPALMILPVLEENQISLDVYLPRGRWYVDTAAQRLFIDSIGTNYTFSSPLETIVLAYRGGYIIPMKQPAQTTAEIRQMLFTLHVALDETGSAHGELFWDDGESKYSIHKGNYNLIEFTCHNKTLRSSVTTAGAVEELTILSVVEVYGVTKSPTTVLVDGTSVDFDYLPPGVLCIPAVGLNFSTPFHIRWI